MMTRQRFLGALCALIGAGTVNSKLFDSKDDFSPATPGDFKVTDSDDSDGLYPFQREGIAYLRNGKIYAPYVPLRIVSLT